MKTTITTSLFLLAATLMDTTASAAGPVKLRLCSRQADTSTSSKVVERAATWEPAKTTVVSRSPPFLAIWPHRRGALGQAPAGFIERGLTTAQPCVV